MAIASQFTWINIALHCHQTNETFSANVFISLCNRLSDNSMLVIQLPDGYSLKEVVYKLRILGHFAAWDTFGSAGIRIFCPKKSDKTNG